LIPEKEYDIYEDMLRCRPWIEAALDRGESRTHDFEHIVEAVLCGKMQFWPAPDACAITEITVYPKKKVFHIFLAGGNMDTIIDMNESAELFGKHNGCTGMSISGRVGWKKMLADKGYKPSFTVLTKEI